MLLIIILFLLSLPSIAAESLSYSGRLVNSNGSPAVGPVKLKFDLFYSNDTTEILCSDEKNGVDLVNGVFHVKLDFNCGATSSLEKVLAETPVANTIVIRVTDITSSSHKIYPYQALHSIPFAIKANFAKQLSLKGTAAGQVLTWNGTNWGAADPASTNQGTVKQVTGADGLYGTITDSGIIGIQDGGVTAVKLHQMGATEGQVLKWKGSSWVPDEDSNTGVGTEADPHVLKFARSDALAMPIPDDCADDEKLQYASGLQTFVCEKIILSDTAFQTAVVDAIVDGEAAKAPSQNAVFDALAGKQNSIDASSDITMKYLKLMTDGAFWVGFKAPIATTGNVLFTLPDKDGDPGEVLKTDGFGNLGWADPASGSVTDILVTAPLVKTGTNSVSLSLQSGGITNDHINAGAEIDQFKIANLTNDLDARQIGDDDLTALAGLTTTGVLVRTGEGTAVTRSLLGAANRVNVSNADGVANNPIIDVSSSLLPSPLAGDTGKFLKASGADASSWMDLVSGDITGALGFTPINKAGDTISSGTFNFNGTSIVRVLDPSGATDVANKQYVDGQVAGAVNQWAAAGGNVYRSSGNVGVGTTNPQQKLTVSDSAEPVIRLDRSGAGLFDWEIYAKNGALLFRGGADNVGTGLTDFMTIDSLGKVGIGTAAPTSRLTIEEDGTTPGLELKYGGANNFATIKGPLNRALRMDIPGNDTGDGLLIRGSQDSGATYPNNVLFARADGNVGIGTTTPTELLTISGDSADHTGIQIFNNIYGTNQGLFFLRKTSTDYAVTDQLDAGLLESYNDLILSAAKGSGVASPSIKFQTGRTGTTGNTRMLIDSTGNVGIGTTTPSEKMDVKGNLAIGARLLSGVDGANNAFWAARGTGTESERIAFGLNADPATGLVNSATISTDGVRRLTINNSGNVGIGTLTPSYRLDVQGGGINTSGTYTNVSDRRLKEDILPLTGSLEKILKLNSVSYVWKDRSFDDSLQIGFIAQEVEKVFPEVVKTDDRGFKAMSYSQLVSPIVKAIQELYEKWSKDHEIIAKQEHENRVLRNEVAKLKAQNESILERLEKLESSRSPGNSK